MLGQFSIRPPRCSVRISLWPCSQALSPPFLPFLVSLPSSWASAAPSQSLLPQLMPAFPQGHPPLHTHTPTPPDHHIPNTRSPHTHMLCAYTTHTGSHCTQAHYTHRRAHVPYFWAGLLMAESPGPSSLSSHCPASSSPQSGLPPERVGLAGHSAFDFSWRLSSPSCSSEHTRAGKAGRSPLTLF